MECPIGEEMKPVVEKKKCYGCGKCMEMCPTHAIHMKKDEEGFLYPCIEEEKCIECGICRKSCISNLDCSKKADTEQVYACVPKDRTIQENSTSGGLGYLLANYILCKNGVVYGAAWNERKVQHIRVSRREELYRIQGTKYVQSDISLVLKDMIQDAKNNRQILFSGTPCQVAAVRSLLGDYENLYGVELVCMGCPSPKVWEMHLESCEKRWGGISEVKFRDKITGWKTSCLSYMVGEEKKYTLPNLDTYMVGFGQCLFLRPSCHSCQFKGNNSKGDIKIGDFWGIENDDDYGTRERGVSLAIIESKKGEELFSSIKAEMEIKKQTYHFALSHNPCIEINKRPSKNRPAFFEEVNNGGQDMDELIKKYCLPQPGEKDRYWCQYPVVNNLLRLKVEGKGIRPYFETNHFQNIIVYGMGELGKLFVRMLQQEGIMVQCIIDKNYKRFPEQFEGVPVVGPHDIHNYEYDCVIVSLVHLYNSVLETLLAQGVDINKILSMGSIV